MAAGSAGRIGLPPFGWGGSVHGAEEGLQESLHPTLTT
jgi:hypothetical protein